MRGRDDSGHTEIDFRTGLFILLSAASGPFRFNRAAAHGRMQGIGDRLGRYGPAKQPSGPLHPAELFGSLRIGRKNFPDPLPFLVARFTAQMPAQQLPNFPRIV